MKSFWHLGAVAALAALCMAPSDCDPSPTPGDAGADASVDATTGAETGSSTTPRQTQSTKDCKNRGVCNATNEIPFSQSECETNNRNDGERADSLGCKDAYDAFLACAASVTYDCSQALDVQIRNRCNATYQAYATCVSNPP